MSRFEVEEIRRQNLDRENPESKCFNLTGPKFFALMICLFIGLAAFLLIDRRHGSAGCENIDHFASYHFHVLFQGSNEENTQGAIELRNNFINEFGLTNDRNCTMGPVDPAPEEPMCVFNVDMEPSGPFLTSQFAFFIQKDDFTVAQEWMRLNHGDYDVLYHPNTGCHVQDHIQWSMWSGDKWQLNTGVFDSIWISNRPL